MYVFIQFNFSNNYKMLAIYICDYLHNSGKICGKACTRPEVCRLHYKCKKRYPCTDCGKPTGAACGRCRLHARGFYTIQYINRLREKGIIVDDVDYIQEVIIQYVNRLREKVCL